MSERKNLILLIIASLTAISITVCLIKGFNDLYKSGEQEQKNWIKENQHIPIQSVNIGNENSGRFILGIGWSGDEQYYYVYQINEDGGKQLKKYDASGVVIYDDLDENEEPYLDRSGYQVKMYLPKDTIKEEYDVDIKK